MNHPKHLLASLGSFRPVVLECRDCDECGASTNEDEMFDNLCPSCQVSDFEEHGAWRARDGGVW